MLDRFIKIEKKYNVDDIEYKGDKIWAYLRIIYANAIMKDIISNYTNSRKKTFLIKLFNMIKQSFYGFKNWFGSYDYFVISNTSCRIKIDDKYIDKSFEKIMEILSYDKVLCLDKGVPFHLPIEQISTKYIVSIDMIYLLTGLFYKLLIFLKINNRISKLELLNKKENLSIDYRNNIIKFNIMKNIMKILLRIYRPKVIFINCYYSYQSIIKAASELNIKTVEVQHGIIGSSHYAYNFYNKVDSSFFPDILLTFGDYDKDIILNNRFNPFKKVIPIGRYSLELIKDTDIPSELLNLIQEYKYSISISTQYTVEDELAIFIKNIALENSDTVFLFSLRHFEKEYYDKFDMPKNIYLFKGEYSCYDILKACQIHMTSYSTCALEAEVFLKPTIVVNINKFTSYYIKDMLYSDNIYNISTETEFDKLKNIKFINSVNFFYKDNYIENIKKFIDSNSLKI